MQIQNKITKLIKEKNWKELEVLCLSQEYQALPYKEKNKQFLTSSKLKAFEECQLGYKLKYVDFVPEPEIERDYFILGTALDDRLTYGENWYGERYITVDRRAKNIDAEIERCRGKIEKAKLNLKKDGERSKVGLDNEFRANQRIVDLKILATKIQLTSKWSETIDNMYGEFMANPMFNDKPTKRVFFHEFGGFVLKIELDDIDLDEVIIKDIKSAANVLKFDPERYVMQMAIYQWVVKENLDERFRVQLEIVDKFADFSRSRLLEYKESTLWDGRKKIVELIGKLKSAHETGLFIRSNDPEVFFRSPYYGHEDYGREDEVIYY